MRRILLVRTDSRAIPRGVAPPLGVLYLASALRNWAKEKLEVEVFDMRLWRRPFSALEKKLKIFTPDIVGLSTLTFEAQEMHQVAELIKKLFPHCPVIVGGPHGTIFYSEILADSNIDYVVVGEGEKILVELVDKLVKDGDISTIRGIATRRNGE